VTAAPALPLYQEDFLVTVLASARNSKPSWILGMYLGTYLLNTMPVRYPSSPSRSARSLCPGRGSTRSFFIQEIEPGLRPRNILGIDSMVADDWLNARSKTSESPASSS